MYAERTACRLTMSHSVDPQPAILMRLTRLLLRGRLVVLAAAVLGCRASATSGGPEAAMRGGAELARLAATMQPVLDSVRQANRWPGLTVGVTLPNGQTLALASGLADTAARTPMRADHRQLQGSVGKTYVAAIALALVRAGRLDLDAPIARYVGTAPWFAGLVTGPRMTVRQLMNHTSGLVRYEFAPATGQRLRAEPMHVWTVADRLAVLAGVAPPFAPGTDWEYSDTNYIVLGAIIEAITGRRYDDLLRDLLRQHGLAQTEPADRPQLTNMATGYAGPNNELGGYNASLKDGVLLINPQFEWTGGGVASTAADLSRWGAALYGGAVLDSTTRALMLTTVPAKLGAGVRYGLGVMVRPTRLGDMWGHSGFFPGYATELVYLPTRKISAAVQVNVTAPYPRGLVPLLVRLVELASSEP